MASKRSQAVSYLNTHGYHYNRTANNGYEIFRGRSGHEVHLPLNPSDDAIAEAHRDVARALGITAPKRSSSRTKARARARAERERAAENKRKAARDAILADIEAGRAEATERRRINDASLDGLGKNLTNREARDVAHHLEDKARDGRRTLALMTSVPNRSVRGDAD